MKTLKNALNEAYDHTNNLKNRTNLPWAEHIMYTCQNWNIRKFIQIVNAVERTVQGLKNKQK